MKILDNNPKPSESQISIHTHQISQNVAQFTENLISNLRQACANTGIFCATTDAENILMWSHYTNYHQGICIEFDNTEDIEMATLFQQVEYQTNNMRPVINPYISSTPDDYDVYNLHKASAWKYENEWRIALANTKHTSMSFNPAYISKVILGVKAAQETVDYIHSINEQRKENTLPTFEIKQAYMADHEFKILH
ncbi:DUF2971 domain-containing protein [Chromobacterium vaccinii]|nr:DUF2971 domain-containing protein [Chromobacterium vaccinii]SUX53843.1 Protein of uncharacterised function (DUF2971) [Chromobacterium vaccinii]